MVFSPRLSDDFGVVQGLDAQRGQHRPGVSARREVLVKYQRYLETKKDIYIYYNGYWDILGYIHGNYEHIWILIGILIGKYWDINGYYYILLHTIVVIDNEEHVLMIMTDNYYCYYSYDWEYHSYLLYKCATDDFYHSFGSRCLWKILSFGSQAAVRRFHQQATQ